MSSTASETRTPAETAEQRRQRIRAALGDGSRRAMTVVIARNLGVGEVEVIREMPPEQVTELDIERWEEIIRDLEPFGDVYVITNNQATTMECHGQFGNFSTNGPFFNVQTDSLDMHIRFEYLDAVFAIEKPGHTDGVSVQSIQFFSRDGGSAFKAFLSFGGRPLDDEKLGQFHALRDKYRI